MRKEFLSIAAVVLPVLAGGPAQAASPIGSAILRAQTEMTADAVRGETREAVQAHLPVANAAPEKEAPQGDQPNRAQRQ